MYKRKEHDDLNWPQGALYVGMVDWAELAEKEDGDDAYYKSVSYTHLDVYKRQSYYRVIVSLCLFVFLLSPAFGDENSAISLDKELSLIHIYSRLNFLSIWVQRIICRFWMIS